MNDTYWEYINIDLPSIKSKITGSVPSEDWGKRKDDIRSWYIELKMDVRSILKDIASIPASYADSTVIQWNNLYTTSEVEEIIQMIGTDWDNLDETSLGILDSPHVTERIIMEGENVTKDFLRGSLSNSLSIVMSRGLLNSIPIYEETLIAKLNKLFL